MRKRFVAALTALAALTAVVASSPATAATDPNYTGGEPVFFLTPHQDDETLTYGASIENLVDEGVDVRVFLLTDGSESGVCYQRYGTPGVSVTEQRYNGGLSPAARAQCTAQRDAEFEQSVTRMGATPVIWWNRKQDSCSNPTIAAEMTLSPCTSSNTLTHHNVRVLIDYLVSKYPNAAFKGMTYHEADDCDGCTTAVNAHKTYGPGHPDHAAIGEGLLNAYKGNDIPSGDVRFYVKLALWRDWPGEQGDAKIGWFGTRENIDYAASSYGPDAPDGDGDGPSQAGNGIGMDSVRSFCEQRSVPTDGQIDPSLDCSGYNYFGDAAESPYGNIATGGADVYIHKPEVDWQPSIQLYNGN